MNEIIKCENVFFSYKEDSHQNILENICFSVDKHQIVCIAGSNGAGKSTLAKIIVGLLAPISGQVICDRTRIGYMQQGIKIAFFHISVRDFVAMGRLLPKRLFFTNQDWEAIDQALDSCDLFHLKNKTLSTLSGGELKRTLLARLLVADKDILILDEPTIHLDIVSRNSFAKLLTDIKEKKTIVFISHDFTLVSGIADKILCLSDIKSDLDHAVFLEYVNTHLSNIPVEHLHSTQSASSCRTSRTSVEEKQ